MSGENGSVRRKVHDAAWEPVTSIEMEALRLLELIGDGDAGMTKGGFGVRAPGVACMGQELLYLCARNPDQKRAKKESTPTPQCRKLLYK